VNGILVVDKAPGMTSHDVVGRVRRAVGVKRVGHAGTLDPDATGVLLVCIGSSTRLADLLAEQGKRYVATLVLGASTDTEDASGTIVVEADASAITEDMLEQTIPGFVGEIEQIPPMVSAVHHEGQRLYELARKGVIVERAARRIRVDSITMHSFEPGARATAVLELACGKGAYVRTLCADIGAALGVGGHMGTLRRTAVGRFTNQESQPVADLTRETVEARLIAAADAVSHLPTVRLSTDTDRDHIFHGRSVPSEGADCDTVAVLDAQGVLIALGALRGGTLQPAKVFPANEPA
jgi:tRNA pseudouridine55 synthase